MVSIFISFYYYVLDLRDHCAENFYIFGVLFMKRFSITMSDEEYETLLNMQRWYCDMIGVRVSRCELIKALLFNIWKDR